MTSHILVMARNGLLCRAYFRGISAQLARLGASRYWSAGRVGRFLCDQCRRCRSWHRCSKSCRCIASAGFDLSGAHADQCHVLPCPAGDLDQGAIFAGPLHRNYLVLSRRDCLFRPRRHARATRCWYGDRQLRPWRTPHGLSDRHDQNSRPPLLSAGSLTGSSTGRNCLDRHCLALDAAIPHLA